MEAPQELPQGGSMRSLEHNIVHKRTIPDYVSSIVRRLRHSPFVWPKTPNHIVEKHTRTRNGTVAEPTTRTRNGTVAQPPIELEAQPVPTQREREPVPIQEQAGEYERLHDGRYRYRRGVTNTALQLRWEEVHPNIDAALYEQSPREAVISRCELQMIGPQPAVDLMEPTIIIFCQGVVTGRLQTVVNEMTFIPRNLFRVEVMKSPSRLVWSSLGVNLDTVVRFEDGLSKSVMGVSIQSDGIFCQMGPRKGATDERVLYFTMGGLLMVNDRLYGLATAHQLYTTSPTPHISIDPSDLATASDLGLTASSTGDLEVPPNMEFGPIGEVSRSVWGSNKSRHSELRKLMAATDWALISIRASLGTYDWERTLITSTIWHNAVGFDSNLGTRGDAREVIVCGGKSGTQKAIMIPYTASIVLGDSRFEVYPIELQHKIVKGDSGSWVLKDDRLCGYIICCVYDSLEAFMLPIGPVVEDIKNVWTEESEHMQASVRIATAQDVRDWFGKVERTPEARYDELEPTPANLKTRSDISHTPSNPITRKGQEATSIQGVPGVNTDIAQASDQMGGHFLGFPRDPEGGSLPTRSVAAAPALVSPGILEEFAQDFLRYNIVMEPELPFRGYSLRGSALVADIELATQYVSQNPRFYYRIQTARYHALHHQLVLGRKIVLTEQSSLHLTVSGDRIFVKPLPMILFSNKFLDRYILESRERYGSACGLLLSYVLLINHQSDLRIAKSCYLLPPGLQWQHWVQLAQRFLDTAHRNDSVLVPRRYLWGELQPTFAFRVLSLFKIREVREVIPADIDTRDWVTADSVLSAVADAQLPARLQDLHVKDQGGPVDRKGKRRDRSLSGSR